MNFYLYFKEILSSSHLAIFSPSLSKQLGRTESYCILLNNFVFTGTSFDSVIEKKVYRVTLSCSINCKSVNDYLFLVAKYIEHSENYKIVTASILLLNSEQYRIKFLIFICIVEPELNFHKSNRCSYRLL